MKIVIRIVLGLVGLAVVGLVIAFFAIDALAKTAVERGGEYALGVETELGEADIGLFSGEFALRDLRVANPPGFDTPAFFRVGSAELALAMESLSSDQIEAPRLVLDGVEVAIERKDGKTNYKEILEHLSRFESGEAKKEEEEPGKRFVIREVVIKNVKAHVDVAPINATVTVPEIRLENLGSAEDGATVAEIVAILVKAVLEETIKSGAGIIPDDLLKDLGKSMAQLTDVAADLGKGVTSGVEKLGKEAGDAVKDVGKKLEGVFKKP